MRTYTYVCMYVCVCICKFGYIYLHMYSIPFITLVITIFIFVRCANLLILVLVELFHFNCYQLEPFYFDAVNTIFLFFFVNLLDTTIYYYCISVRNILFLIY